MLQICLMIYYFNSTCQRSTQNLDPDYFGHYQYWTTFKYVSHQTLNNQEPIEVFSSIANCCLNKQTV